ncbi:hypothetical protein SESBI_33682 [Sesbania bispinosa]|nr:hypothetical protein SESBI_33682 [Sesbania bispinosa]
MVDPLEKESTTKKKDKSKGAKVPSAQGEESEGSKNLKKRKSKVMTRVEHRSGCFIVKAMSFTRDSQSISLEGYII